MKTILTKYKFDEIWHFTDKSNLDLIIEHKGLLSLGELDRRGINIPILGGNNWSHDADKIKGVQEYVHLAFIDDHPMLYRAKQEGRIPEPIWLKIDSSILLEDNVLYTLEVSNKAGVPILQPEEAIEEIDFEVLSTRTDWSDPEIQARRQAALKSEILIPDFVPIEKILGYKNG
jgi:hypothetical protein